jgi:catechol 2,3-dioxygenase-like lactoylglutathione lyase family enzyme
MPIPEGSEVARAFLPSKDFAASKRFYETLGFEKLFDGEAAIYEVGASSFILQNYFQKDWAENCVVQLLVDDLDAWWRHIEGLDLAANFGVQDPKPPAVQPWGLKVAYVFDPAGVLWQVTERAGGNAAE